MIPKSGFGFRKRPAPAKAEVMLHRLSRVLPSAPKGTGVPSPRMRIPLALLSPCHIGSQSHTSSGIDPTKLKRFPDRRKGAAKLYFLPRRRHFALKARWRQCRSLSLIPARGRAAQETNAPLQAKAVVVSPLHP
jgi:hypothetical protein